MTTPSHIDETEARRRTILRTDWVPCKAAFIDCRTPGSDRKDNYSFIGPGVTQSSQQVINLEEPHGFNVGAAGMPQGTTNSLHMHFTAEVFINFGGDYLLRWGHDGQDGEMLSHDGDVVSVPTWIFRGFTNLGADDGILLTVLGGDDTGGIIWSPTVLADAEAHGLKLTRDNKVVDTLAGEQVPEGVELMDPLSDDHIAGLATYSVDDFAGRLVQPQQRVFEAEPFLCSRLDGGGAELALVIGYGQTERRGQQPRLHEPHHFSLAWLRAATGEGLLRHRHDKTQVLTVRSGRWRVTLNEAQDVSVELGRLDTLSVPEGTWRSITCLEAGTDGTGEMLVVDGGDERVRLEWAPEVVAAARAGGVAIDPNGYLAPVGALSAVAG